MIIKSEWATPQLLVLSSGFEASGPGTSGECPKGGQADETSGVSVGDNKCTEDDDEIGFGPS